MVINVSSKLSTYKYRTQILGAPCLYDYTKGRKVFVCDFSKAKLIYKIKRFLRYFLSA